MSTIQSYSSHSPAYQSAFHTFLRHTDQKAQVRSWLRRFVERLPARGTLLDVGAGNGTLTAVLAPRFDQTVAVEPNPDLSAALAVACPQAEIFHQPIQSLDAQFRADLVLCSFVLVYLSKAERRNVLEKLLAHASGGTLVVIEQATDTDFVQMYRHFGYHGPDLDDEVEQLAAGYSSALELEFHDIPSTVRAPDFDTLYTIAEFMLNAVLEDERPPRRELEDYLRRTFLRPSGVAELSCTQRILVARGA